MLDKTALLLAIVVRCITMAQVLIGAKAVSNCLMRGVAGVHAGFNLDIF